MYIPILTHSKKDINPAKAVMKERGVKRVSPGSNSLIINEATESLARSNQSFAYSSR